MFGITLWEMLYRSVPYPGEGNLIAAQRVLSGVRPDLSQAPPPVRFQHIPLVSGAPAASPAFDVFRGVPNPGEGNGAGSPTSGSTGHYDSWTGSALELPSSGARARLVSLMVRCWAEIPEQRPTMADVARSLRSQMKELVAAASVWSAPPPRK